MVNYNKVIHRILDGKYTIKDEVKKKLVRFYPNKSQRKILKIIVKNLLQNKKTKLIIIKGRQVGGSSLIQRLQLDFALAFSNFNCYVQAHEQVSASRMFLENVKNVFDQMVGVKDLYKTSLDNVNQLYFKEFKKNIWNSEVRVGTSARSAQVDFLHISEAGKIGNETKKWRELVDGTLEAGEQALITVIESTAEGKNLFYEWVQRQKKNPDWEILFLTWTDKKLYKKEPPKDDSWKQDYLELAKEYGLKINPVRDYGLNEAQFYWYYLKALEKGHGIKKEYPLDIEEAFATTSNSFFRKSLIEQRYLALENYKPAFQDEFVKVFQKPEPNKTYFAGVDTANEGKDSYSLDIIDGFGNQILTLEGRFKDEDGQDDGTLEKSGTERFKVLLLKYLNLYNQPFLTIERQGTGENIQRFILSNQYPQEKIWRDTNQKSLLNNPDFKLGWYTDKNSRVTMLIDLQSNFHSGWLKIFDKKTLYQFDKFVKKDGKWQAEAGSHDDKVISLGLAIQSLIFANNK